jgi:HAD superfamily hydrolase (TIGR01549 family)
MLKIKSKLKDTFFLLPNQSKIKLYRRLYQGKTPLFSGLWEWCIWKCQPHREEPHDVFLDYSQTQGIYTVEKLIERMSFMDGVSFDIFDTLLFRRVKKPIDVFSQMEQRVGIPGFAAYRVESERKARQKKQEERGSMEVTLSEIYAQMTAYPVEQCLSMQQTELFIEKEQLFANPVMKELVEGLTARNIPLIAISDMYLDQETISQLLRSCGYPPFKRIYVSSEEGVSKSEGELFRRVRELEHWEGKHIAHIGDNFHSDVRMGKNWVEKTIHYLR